MFPPQHLRVFFFTSEWLSWGRWWLWHLATVDPSQQCQWVRNTQDLTSDSVKTAALKTHKKSKEHIKANITVFPGLVFWKTQHISDEQRNKRKSSVRGFTLWCICHCHCWKWVAVLICAVSWSWTVRWDRQTSHDYICPPIQAECLFFFSFVFAHLPFLILPGQTKDHLRHTY